MKVKMWDSVRDKIEKKYIGENRKKTKLKKIKEKIRIVFLLKNEDKRNNTRIV